MNRPALKSASNSAYKSDMANTRAIDCRGFNDDLIDSVPNYDEDGDQPGGFPILNNNGLLDPAIVKSPATPPDLTQFLRSDGIYATPSGSAPTTVTKSIAGSAPVDLSGLSGIVIVGLTIGGGGGTESVSFLDNAGSVDFVYLIPENGLTLNIDDLSTGPGTGGNIILDNRTQKTCNGTRFGFIKLMRRGSVFYEEIFKDQYA